LPRRCEIENQPFLDALAAVERDFDDVEKEPRPFRAPHRQREHVVKQIKNAKDRAAGYRNHDQHQHDAQHIVAIKSMAIIRQNFSSSTFR